MPDERAEAGCEWPRVRVVPGLTTSKVVWTGGDGKPRCARHPYICLVRATAVGLSGESHFCARCMREVVPIGPLCDEDAR